MGKYHVFAYYLLGLLCAASFAFSPVATAGTVSVDVSPTTGYIVTNRSTVALPPMTTTGPVATYNPTFGPLAGGGAYQTTSSGVTITAVKDGVASSTTMSGRVRATAGAMKNGLGRCLTSFRCNLALMVGSAGIESLFDGIDWIMGEGGRPVKVSRPYPQGQPANYGHVLSGQASSYLWCSGDRVCFGPLPGQPPNGTQYACFLTNLNAPLIAYDKTAANRATCFYGLPGTSFIPPEVREPVTASEIESNVNSSYTPHPSDLPYLSTGGLDFGHSGVDFEILDIPGITGADSPTFIERSDGTTTGTYSEYDFSWSGPSKQPRVDVEEKTSETTYGPSGEVTSTTTTIVKGAGSSANVPPETPTDCDFMPTVCRFIDWFTEPDTETQQDVDFAQLIDTVDIDKTYTVGSGTAACPQPFTVNLSWVPSVEVSIQPFCDLADLLRPLLLAIASILSGMIILRT